MGVEEQTQTPGDLKTRVNACLSKLSDRDTLSMAANELENIARGLQKEAFAPFLKCVMSADSSEKSPVRRQRVRLLAVMCAAHGDALSPHISRMISVVLGRLRDADSAVRAACVEAVSSIAAHVNGPPFSAIVRPLAVALAHEQDFNAQLAAALCLAAAVEASLEPDKEELRKLFPRVMKLSKSDSFKAKPALISLIAGILSADCLKSKSLRSVASAAVEFLGSEDWAVRKAAAELLERVAVFCDALSPEQRVACVAALQTRRFDKVKLVRETMNRALESWKDQLEEDPRSLRVHRRYPAAATSSPPSSCSSSSSSQKSTLTSETAAIPVAENHQDFEEISVIRQQLLQIESQQSALLVLLQKFIGSSQKGMSSLEERVDGLEKMLQEISGDPRLLSCRSSLA